MARTGKSKSGGRQRAEPKAAKEAAQAGSAASSSTGSSDVSVDDLLQKAHVLLAQQDYELAARFLTRILTADPAQIEARELIGLCLLELGQVGEAREHFNLLVSSPASANLSGPYLYLAQLSYTPQESLTHYESAVRILEAQLAEFLTVKNPANPSEEEQTVERELRKQIAHALVGMTEVYLTDLCFEPGAEDKCDLLLTKALNVSPTDAESWVCLASVRMSQQREEDAKQCVEKGWETWRGKELGDLARPPISTQLSLARILLELDLHSYALEVLRGVREEDDEDVEAAYLEGWAWFLRGEKMEQEGAASGNKGKAPVKAGDAEEADEPTTKQECWEEARESLTMCEIMHKAQQHPAEEVLSHTRELLAQLDQAGIRPAQGVVDEEELDEAGEGGGEWEADDDDDEMEE